MSWQPIETAPKRIPKPGDNIALGRPEIILGWEGSDTVTTGYWSPGRNEDGEWDQDGKGRWVSATNYIAFSPPTHWQPLPLPPGHPDQMIRPPSGGTAS